MEPVRPAVSRETRRLLTVVCVALAMLWMLARIRFPDRPPTPNPVSPVLAQLSAQPPFDGLAEAVAAIQPRIESLLVVVSNKQGTISGRQAAGDAMVALRWRNNLGIAAGVHGWSTGIGLLPGDLIVAQDPAISLALVRVPDQLVPSLSTWVPRRVDSPRFLIAADPLEKGISLRPVFIGALSPLDSEEWLGSVWVLPPRTALAPGTFLFTTYGALAGLTLLHGDRIVLVPPDLLFQSASRLLEQEPASRGRIGIDVTALDQRLGAAIGASDGVAVVWVDPQSPAARVLRPADVIETIDGTPVQSPKAWYARQARLAEGEAVVLTVRRGAEVREVRITAAPWKPEPVDLSFGLDLRTIRSVGAEVTSVDPGSSGARAGLQAGDVVTLAGTQPAPTAADVRRWFLRATDEQPLVVAVTRGETHLVLVMEKAR